MLASVYRSRGKFNFVVGDSEACHVLQYIEATIINNYSTEADHVVWVFHTASITWPQSLGHCHDKDHASSRWSNSRLSLDHLFA